VADRGREAADGLIKWMEEARKDKGRKAYIKTSQYERIQERRFDRV
jgi:hypothetical protein